MRKQKSLGQIAYEGTYEGGRSNFGTWENAPDVVRRVHEQMAKAVAREVLRRRRAEVEKIWRNRGR